MSRERTSKHEIQEHTSLGTSVVFVASVIITGAVIVWALVAGGSFIGAANTAMSALTASFDWLYVFGCTFFVLFAIVLAVSPYGKTRLGTDSERPRQSLFGWFAMLFSAGMGVGLVFWGIAEPIAHYIAPMAGIEPLTDDAARFALRSCYLHWGLHPWSGYAIVGLALGYFGFRLRKESLVSSTLEPVLHKQSRGALGIIIDIYVALLTVMGVATSFGMGCLQISAGLDHMFGVPSQVYTWAIVIGLCAIVYTWSVVSGIERGMQLLSNVTMILCVVLMALVLVVGPHVEIMRGFMIGVGDWLANLIQDSLRLTADNGDASWVRTWRVFYWAWWLSWAPFVGIFLARISRGRTIREFVLGTVIAPTVLSIVWFSIFGGMAFKAADNFSADQLASMVASPEIVPFNVFEQFPLAAVLSVIALVLLFGFFVTSANSATFVLAMLTSKGNPQPPTFKKVFWGVLLALVSFAFVVSGGVKGIQTITIIVSFPFFFVMLAMCASTVVAIHREHRDGLPQEVYEAWEEDDQALA